MRWSHRRPVGEHPHGAGKRGSRTRDCSYLRGRRRRRRRSRRLRWPPRLPSPPHAPPRAWLARAGAVGVGDRSGLPEDAMVGRGGLAAFSCSWRCRRRGDRWRPATGSEEGGVGGRGGGALARARAGGGAMAVDGGATDARKALACTARLAFKSIGERRSPARHPASPTVEQTLAAPLLDRRTVAVWRARRGRCPPQPPSHPRARASPRHHG